MHVVSIPSVGGPEVLTFMQASKPHPGPTDVVVTVAGAGVNRADLLQRQGLYPAPPGASDVPGLEFSGTVDAIGTEVTQWRVGQRVAGLVDGGGYASSVVVPAAQLLPVPTGMDLIDAAGLPEALCTVWSNLVDDAGLVPGEWLLLHGGSGGVGTVAIQMAVALGARVMVTAGTRERVDRCLALGAECGFVYRDGLPESLPGLVREATDGHGADVVLDVVGAAYLDANVRSLAIGGRLVVIGLQKGRRGELDLGRLLTLRARVGGSTLRARPTADKARIVAAVRERVWPWVVDGRVRPVIDSRMPLREAARAHERLQSGEVFGKVLLLP